MEVKWGFDLYWMLLGSRDNSMTGYLNRSYLEGERFE